MSTVALSWTYSYCSLWSESGRPCWSIISITR
uniref:Uncharacterized protein n=1 Tax=Arundo donax TaxID=35708 RepID=A0A0A9HQU1_ARUDO